ncbi:hypothetical protein PVAP13_5KG772866 [Panicum virgatum]|uniref:NB-ARC domain-containing protein n=1 Tax=Panicum virgatum TaxID=38727 RepID=A0A8T0T2G3_PANVG|nr:hypothetical protein PVAP13_5KG772866 [Panicum virgatum]
MPLIVVPVLLGILVVFITKLWDPIAEYVGYPLDVRRRVEDLQDAVQRLRSIQADLHRLDPRPSSEQGKGWVQSVQNLCLKEEKIKTGYDGCGLNYLSYCYFSKQADKEMKKATDLIVTGKELLKEAQAKPHPVRDVPPQHPQDQLWGMDSYKKKVRDFIQDTNTKSGLLGIWGMAGVGKTSLVKLFRDSSAEYAPLDFDHVLFVRAGRGCTVGDTQKAIAASMRLPVVPDETSQEGIIYNHFKDKNFLLLQDDARKLFEDKVGKEIIKDTQLGMLARELADECGGLAMALCTIGQAMSTKKDPKEWRSAINLLKKSKLLEITNTDEELFERLKFDYDKMTENRKKCFLMCSLWAEDKNIPKEKLIEWWVGLGFLDASDSVNEGYFIINGLVDASMLEKGDNGLDSTENSHVKMHKMIRKMALWIVNDRGHQNIWLPHSVHRLAFSEEKWSKVERAWISTADTSRWSSSIRCPHLVMLVARQPFSLESAPNFEDITFLDLEGINLVKFPSEICGLDRLQYLNLSASEFDGLHEDLTKLSNLKYLHIRGIGGLQTIPKDLISQLKKLQLLDLFCSGATSHKVQYLTSLLEELESKTINLLYFGITVHTRADIEQLEKLFSSVCTQALCMDQFEDFFHERALARMSLRRCEFEDERHLKKIDLRLLSCLENMRELAITKSSVQVLVAEGHNEYGLLPNLGFLELRNLSKLQAVTWKNAGLDIRVVVINRCTKLRHATWVRHLQRLEELTISECPELKQVINNAEEAHQAGVSFCKLRKLKLELLPELFNISEQDFPFKELSYVRVADCEKLKFIKIQQRINQKKIRIDCNIGWWTSSVENQGIASSLFDPRFCL